MAQSQSRAGGTSTGRDVASRLGEAARDRLGRVYATRGSTPFRLRVAMLATVVLVLAFGVAGNYGINRRGAAIADARRAATQLLALQEIRVAVVEADSIASRSFLVGGQEQGEQRKNYSADLDAATSQVVAVGLQLDLPQDQTTALSSVSSSLTAYSVSWSRHEPTTAKASRSAPPTSDRRTRWSPTRSCRRCARWNRGSATQSTPVWPGLIGRVPG